jgi:hypothetical protein
MGMSHNGLRDILNAPPSHRVQKAKLRSCMLEVISMRRKGEVRHRDSIVVGASKRGWIEKVPEEQQDLYRPHGDRETEYKRKSRRLAS